MCVLFISLWYLPAVYRVRSLWKPIKYPLFNFVVDDFTLLGIRPEARDARPTYAIAVFRVCILLIMAPLLFRGSVVPEGFRHYLENTDSVAHIREKQISHGDVFELLWNALGWIVIVTSFLWVCITVHMALVRHCCGFRSPLWGERNEEMLRRIDKLALKIEAATTQQPAECRMALLSLQEECPKLKLATFLKTFAAAWNVVLHMGVDIYNIFTFALEPDILRAVFLSLVVFATVLYMVTYLHHGVGGIYHTSKLSWDRGVFTNDYMTFVRADTGIQRIPEFIISASGLAFAPNNLRSILPLFGSMFLCIVSAVPFIYKENDLGIERQGLSMEAVLLSSEIALESGSDPLTDPANAHTGGEGCLSMVQMTEHHTFPSDTS